MKMCHEGPGLPREVLDEVARLDEDMPIDEDDDTGDHRLLPL
jgi:hypothetical protein